MLNLDAEKQAQQPWWFTVHDAVGDTPAVRVQFAPIGRIALRAARRAAGEIYRAAAGDQDDDAPLSMEMLEAAGDALSDTLLMSGIIAWEGVGDAAGTVAPVTPENIALFLADPVRFEKLDNAYVQPFVRRQMEKNGLSPSPNGISTGATLGEDIASTSAKPTASGDAIPMASMPDAPIGNMSPSPTPE